VDNEPINVRMSSWEALPSARLDTDGPLRSAFARAGAMDYRTAARLVSLLEYGRNNHATDMLVVLRERRGTCSSKHALLRRLAEEQRVGIKLVLGVYEMNDRNTPGVGAVLDQYGLGALPEAHCYLRNGHVRVDATRDYSKRGAPSFAFLHEEEISPDQAGRYKMRLHRDFLAQWARRAMWSVDELWRIREECIQALSAGARTA
jgi:hypothetical protein